MAELLRKMPEPYEPLRENRWIIKFNKEVNVPEYLFRKFKIENSNEDLILTTEIIETVDYSFNLGDIFKITDIFVEYLDPTGVVVNGMMLPVKGSNFKKKCDYGKNGIMTIKFRFVIEGKEVKMFYPHPHDGKRTN